MFNIKPITLILKNQIIKYRIMYYLFVYYTLHVKKLSEKIDVVFNHDKQNLNNTVNIFYLFLIFGIDLRVHTKFIDKLQI